MTTKAIQKQAAPDNGGIYESLALRGDLSGLRPEEKAQYYSALCERLGLDPSTQPFALLKLNGKEIMYATKGCTDQLARIHGVNRTITKEETINDCYIVTVEAALPNGRIEQSKGAVSISGLKADAFCNAIMKAETKSKRRATLSILGLGLLDESELETIPERSKQSIPAAIPARSTAAEGLAAGIRHICHELNASGRDEVKWTGAVIREMYGVDIETADVEAMQPVADELGERLAILMQDNPIDGEDTTVNDE